VSIFFRPRMPCPEEGCGCQLTPTRLDTMMNKELVNRDPEDRSRCLCGHPVLVHTDKPYAGSGDEPVEIEVTVLQPMGTPVPSPHSSGRASPAAAAAADSPGFMTRFWPKLLVCGGAPSVEDDDKFRRKLMEYYECQAPNGKVHCMALALPYSSHDVLVARVWRPGPNVPGLDSYGLRRTDYTNPRNGLLFLRGIKEAFDTRELCLVANPLKASQHALSIKVLNPELMNQIIRGSSSHRFKDIAGKLLRLPVDRTPFLRLLSWHARAAHKLAVQRGWCTQDVLDGFQEYFDWADIASPRGGTFTTPHWEPFTRPNGL
jgi:hypothetical protein